MIILLFIAWLILVVLILRFFEASKPKQNDNYNRTKDTKH